MIYSTFSAMFSKATGNNPYPYQERFANAAQILHLIRAPTGAGKTATAILGWLWRRQDQPDKTPRRLVYCLPMRVLVEQSFKEATQWIKCLGLKVPVYRLMGGVETEDWHFHPENPAILIGTQDMLLSRVLNRGYGESRFRWPIDFGLLNNDCLWVFDEPQLMGSGVSTSAQLAGLRAALGTFASCPSVWMSATLEPGWLDTIDFQGKFSESALELGSDRYGDDYDPARPLNKRMTADKTLAPLGVAASRDVKEVAAAVLKLHEPGTQTLVVLNTVTRAKALYAALQKDKTKQKTFLLVHSRFRPFERESLNNQLTQPSGDRIIVATQVVEAGVDISSRTLITDLAPWASIVQRIGRCNRTGDDGPGRVFWIDLDPKTQAAPYEPDHLRSSRKELEKLAGHSVSPKALDDFKRQQAIKLEFKHIHVLRRRDLLDLFDTSPDLSGNDIDISRFVRGDDPETDVQVFWRAVSRDGPAENEPSPVRHELCSVPIGEIKTFLEKKKPLVGYVWDYLEEQWLGIRDPQRMIRPGMTILLPSSAGGYSDLGWDAGDGSSVKAVPIDMKQQPDGTGNDPNSCGPALTIAAHTQNVCDELADLLKTLSQLPEEWRKHLAMAARWHDIGKGHDVFQRGIRSANDKLDDQQLWAKSGNSNRLRYSRRYFRHELASALVTLQHNLPFEVAYLIMTHHGKVRLSIRALPNEDRPFDPETMFALGVHHGDRMPPVDLGSEISPALTLDLSPMQLGYSSWTARALALLDKLGPMKLAYLEALLRVADLRASQKEKEAANYA